MDPQVQLWMPAILALFGSLIVVVLTAWINTRMLSAQIDALRSEIEAGLCRTRTEAYTAVSVRLDARALAWLRSKGEGHLTRINDILTNLMEAEEGRERQVGRR
jgi:uncharacterized protein (DUF4415 family)